MTTINHNVIHTGTPCEEVVAYPGEHIFRVRAVLDGRNHIEEYVSALDFDDAWWNGEEQIRNGWIFETMIIMTVEGV